MKVGVVGCGRISTLVHLPSLRKIKGYEVTAAADVNEARLREMREKFGIEDTYVDYKRMLVKADIDAVFVCTPPQHHFQVVMDSIEWGKHVLCEKPLAATVKEGLKIKKALTITKKTGLEGLFLMPAHNFVFTPCFTEALKLIEEGEIGKIRKIRGRAVSNLRFYGAKTDFRLQAKSGVIEDQLPHMIYLCHKVGGSLKRVFYVEPSQRGGLVSYVDVEAKLKNGVEVGMSAGWLGFVPTLKLDLIGEEGEIRLDLLRKPYNITVVKEGEVKTTNMGRRIRQYLDVLRYKHPSYRKEHIHFLECVEAKAKPQVTVDDGIELVRTLNEVLNCFEGKISSTTQAKMVAILRVGENLEETVQKSVEILGGLNVKKDDLLVVKPNVCYPKNPENMVITDPRVLEAVLNMTKRKTQNVVVVESNSFSGTAEKRVTNTGIMDVIKKCGAEFLNLSKDEVEEHNVAGLTLQIPKTVLRADFLINLPKLKTHTFMMMTGAMKNVFGLLANDKKSTFHSRLADVLVYLNRTIRQDLIIVDGIVGMEGLGPIHGSPIKLGLIISGLNPVTVDAACCHIMGFNPYAVEAIWKAHQQGIGEIDIERIQFAGENIRSVKTKFSHPGASPKNVFSALRTELKLRLKK